MPRAKPIPLLLVLISALAPAATGWASAGCVPWLGMTACPLGQAALAQWGGGIVLSNIGCSGDDGVDVTPPGGAVGSIRLVVEPDSVPDPVGASYDVTWTGQVNGVPDDGLISLREAIEIGGAGDVTPDFAGIGSPDYSLRILDGSLVVYEEPFRTGPAVTIPSGAGVPQELGLVPAESTAYVDVGPVPVPVTVVGGPTVLGTRVQFQPTVWLTVDYISVATVVAADVGTFLLTDVQAISTAAPSGLPDPPGPVHLGRNRPNPFRPSTSIPLHLERERYGSVSVYAIDGRRVRTLMRGTLPAGATTLRWDGRDQAGREVGSGVYVVRLMGSGLHESRAITLLR